MAAGIVLFILLLSLLIYSFLSLNQKWELVKEEISNPIFEEHILIARIQFLCRSLQSSHYKILSYITQDQDELIESEISSLKELTATRLHEMEKLHTALGKIEQETTPKLLLQNLKAKVAVLDSKQDEFIHEVEQTQKDKIASNKVIKLSKEWNDLHQQVLDIESSFLLHHEKENKEAEELLKIINKQSLEKMYFILGGAILLLLLLLLLLYNNDSFDGKAKKRNKKYLAYSTIGFILLLFIPIWFWLISPELARIPDDFEYNVLVFSRDNLYDAGQEEFGGEFVSNTEHYYQVANKIDGILLIRTVFNVQNFNGEEIFSVKRIYGIDSKTRKHVPDYGDKRREGYLFGSPHLQKGQNFTYWHVNYNTPAHMEYRAEESIAGLTVYRYETDYHADQTVNLANVIPALSDKGIITDINLQLWVEPVTGRKIKYEDQATAYYYNLTTGERIHPWNKFHNTVDEISVLKQVEIAKYEKLKRIFFEKIITSLLAAAALVLLLFPLLSQILRSRK